MMPLLSKKTINSILTLDFCRRFSFGRGEFGEHHESIDVLIPVRTGSTRSHLPWRCFREAMGPNHTWKWSIQKFPSVSLCGTNREQVFRLPKASRTMVCAVSLLMPNSSAINLSVSRWSCASICRTFSIISGALLVGGRPEHGSSQSFPSLRESVWTIRKHISCSRIPSRTPAPTFHAYPLQFSPICRKTLCLNITPLRCDTTSHIDYISHLH